MAKIDVYLKVLQQEVGGFCVAEYKFHESRKWRFDFAFPEKRVAIEIDGGIWQYGRHNRAAGLLNDYEKFNEAAALGWKVLHFTPQQQYTQYAFELIKRALEQI